MQGRFPYKTGMQHFNTIMPASTAAMPQDQPTLAELFKKVPDSPSMLLFNQVYLMEM